MAFTKYQSAGQTKVVQPDEAQRISANLHGLGKTSARDLSDEERRKALATK